MPPLPEVQAYQRRIADLLCQIYPEVPVKSPWSAMSGERHIYSPQVDVAVGPFATGTSRCFRRYDQLTDDSRQFIEEIIASHLQNIRDYEDWTDIPEISYSTIKSRNRNARCLLVIEVENQVSRKHLMGGAINAAALGRIGIVIGWTEEKLRAFVKLRRYFQFLAAVGKNTFDTTNLVILGKDQLLQAAQNAVSNQ